MSNETIEKNTPSSQRSSSSGSDESTNTTEEERLRNLFDSCDHDQDGYLDRQDFVDMCNRLNMSDMADEIIQQLGLSENQLISFNDFLAYKYRVMSESGYIQEETCYVHSNIDVQFSQDPLSYSSGDISGAPNNMSSWLTMSSENSLGGHSGKPESTDYDSGARDLSPEPSCLNRVALQGHDLHSNDDGYTTLQKDHVMPMGCRLKGGLDDLTNQLVHLTTDRDILERRLNKTQEECQDRIEHTVSRYEERITELHSVIAELQKKIVRQNSNIIQEEDEISDTCSLGADCDRSPTPSLEELCTGNCDLYPDAKFTDIPASNIYENLTNSLDSKSKLRVHNISTPPPLTANDDEPSEEKDISQLHMAIKDISNDRDRLRGKLKQMEQKFHNSEHLPPPQYPQSSSLSQQCTSPNRPLPKVAELKRLKPLSPSSTTALKDTLTSPDVVTSQLADKIVYSLQDCNTFDDLIYLIQNLSEELSFQQARELQLINEQLQCNIDNLKAQNHVVSLTLEESRAQSERLSVLIGKYESNNTALQLAVGYSEQALEVYDVLSAFQESEQGLLLANCRAAGLGAIGKDGNRENHDEITSVLQQAQISHKSAESLSRHLIHKLEPLSNTQAVQPWHDHSSTSSTGSSTEYEHNEKQQLKDIVARLKCERAAVNTTVMELESVHVDPCLLPDVDAEEPSSGDLEQAVLLQEMMMVKEEKAELKAQNYLLEKEKRSLELQLSGKESQEKAYLVHIDQLKSDLGDHTQISRDLNNDGSCQDHDLSDSLKRERKLKHRVQELVGTLEKLSRNSETRHQQSADFISDLKHANTALISAFEKAKKKYQNKIKKLESHLDSITEASHNQMEQLKQRISQLETDSLRSRIPNETSL